MPPQVRVRVHATCTGTVQEDTTVGIDKHPIAAGKGTGGRPYDIVKGEPENSIMVYRMESDNPGEMMPEVGRKLVHEEGVALIKEWISKM